MSGNFGLLRAHSLGCCSLTLMLLLLSEEVHASRFTVLHAFTGPPADGANSVAGLVTDRAGNFYGTTEGGGSTDNCGDERLTGCGTVFKLSPDGSETVLHVFTNGGDGAYPHAGLIADKKGNLYGTTSLGGKYGAGTIFRVKSDGAEKILHSFAGPPSDGVYPTAGLIKDTAGNLYGTTFGGGAYSAGTVFKLTGGTETVLYSFTGGSDGGSPEAGLIADDGGNFYGTTDKGGSYGTGTVFKVAPDATETVLYSFCPVFCPDGSYSAGGVIMDGDGNLYGTTHLGGKDGFGTVFKLASDGTETVLHYFTGGSDGAFPYSDLIADKSGNLYGTTIGDSSNKGTVFKVEPGGTEKVLHTFDGGRGGAHPYAGLIIGTTGDLYGTTYSGGETSCHVHPRGCGIVFKLEK
jgi:uncharacterized repeat protein (TIGR03803 family)